MPETLLKLWPLLQLSLFWGLALSAALFALVLAIRRRFRGFLIGIPITLGMSLVLAFLAVGIASN